MREDITPSVECSCRETRREVSDALIEVFARVRSRCAALAQILVPDALWSDFQEWHARTDEEALHRSALLLALKRGHLERITSPVHTYLLADGRPRADLRKQYLQDLGERWMHYADPLERHRKSRIFFGRLVELQCAEWLEALGWEIAGLEALREGPDIEARRQRGQLTAFEVKFIGMDNVDFEVVRMSLKGESAGAAVSPYSATNYLLFRAYEAAKQLQEVKHARVALLVVDDQTPDRFEYG